MAEANRIGEILKGLEEGRSEEDDGAGDSKDTAGAAELPDSGKEEPGAG